MTKPDYELFDRNTTAIVYGMQTAAIQRMLDFDYLCQRDTPSVAAIVNPTGEGGYHRAFFGKKEILIPIYRTIAEAAHAHPNADVLVNFASFRSAFPTTMEALAQPAIRTVGVIAKVTYGLTSLNRERGKLRHVEFFSTGHCVWRRHRAIENHDHYVRDLTLGEDHCQVHTGAVAQALTALRHQGWENIAAALRHYGASTRKALILIGATAK